MTDEQNVRRFAEGASFVVDSVNESDALVVIEERTGDGRVKVFPRREWLYFPGMTKASVGKRCCLVLEVDP